MLYNSPNTFRRILLFQKYANKDALGVLRLCAFALCSPCAFCPVQVWLPAQHTCGCQLHQKRTCVRPAIQVRLHPSMCYFCLLVYVSPYQTNLLIGGWDEKAGPSLYFLDYLASLQKVNYAAHGYCGYFCLSILDRHVSFGARRASVMFCLFVLNFFLRSVDKVCFISLVRILSYPYLSVAQGQYESGRGFETSRYVSC